MWWGSKNAIQRQNKGGDKMKFRCVKCGHEETITTKGFINLGCRICGGTELVFDQDFVRVAGEDGHEEEVKAGKPVSSVYKRTCLWKIKEVSVTVDKSPEPLTDENVKEEIEEAEVPEDVVGISNDDEDLSIAPEKKKIRSIRRKKAKK